MLESLRQSLLLGEHKLSQRCRENQPSRKLQDVLSVYLLSLRGSGHPHAVPTSTLIEDAGRFLPWA